MSNIYRLYEIVLTLIEKHDINYLTTIYSFSFILGAKKNLRFPRLFNLYSTIKGYSEDSDKLT